MALGPRQRPRRRGDQSNRERLDEVFLPGLHGAKRLCPFSVEEQKVRPSKVSEQRFFSVGPALPIFIAVSGIVEPAETFLVGNEDANQCLKPLSHTSKLLIGMEFDVPGLPEGLSDPINCLGAHSIELAQGAVLPNNGVTGRRHWPMRRFGGKELLEKGHGWPTESPYGEELNYEQKGMRGLVYLGHIIGSSGVKIDPEKTKKENRHFLSRWGEDPERAFRALKEKVCEGPVLAMPDVHKPFKIKTDASAHALGVVLWQDGRVVAYHSEMFNTALLNFPHTRSRCPTATGCVCSMQHIEAVQQEVGALSAQYLFGHGKAPP
ncbi:hypothetical protein AgCh_028590 [Apium graveolens]